MGKKGSKRKTRWRILSIGAPPGEEDEEEGLRNGYTKGTEADGAGHRYERNGQSGYKPRRQGTGTSGTSGYSSTGGSRSRHEDTSSGSPSQPKIIFNEDEYTRITTPRQDVLFKKGYLSRKKPSASNASTSATPSTTESQSASHSTAGRDGSETTEDQQLLDCGAAEYPGVVKPGAQLGYGTFYDHASGYYYEYPVMLVGPGPVPGHVGPGAFAAVPCGPVPLRPIEWVNPAFVPKLSNHQPYCMMDYQTGQGVECVPLVEEHPASGCPLLPVETSNGARNESGTGSASCSGSVAEEPEDQQMEEAGVVVEEQTCGATVLENGVDALASTTGGGYIEAPMVQQPVHMPHMMPAVPQTYMYPGHYMFGPSLINVNGVTVQSGPMIRTTELPGADVACAKRKKKKKKRKQRKPVVGNTEDEEEEDYSSECEDGVPSSRLAWSGCPEPEGSAATTTNHPLNPECQEFQLRASSSETRVSPGPSGSEEPSSSEARVSSGPSGSEEPPSSPLEGVKGGQQALVEDATVSPSPTTNRLSNAAAANHSGDSSNEANRLSEDFADCREITTSTPTTSSTSATTTTTTMMTTKTMENLAKTDRESDGPVVNEQSSKISDTGNVNLSNGELPAPLEVPKPPPPRDKTCSKSPSEGKTRGKSNSVNKTAERSSQPPETTSKKKKFTGKSLKIVREATPGPDLEVEKSPKVEEKVDDKQEKVVRVEEKVETAEDAVLETEKEPKILQNEKIEQNDSDVLENKTECSNEDSGFESQTQTSAYPITEAVTEWLRRANSPDVFIVSRTNEGLEEGEEDDETDEDEPPKNLQSNPMPALSVNSVANDELSSSREANCGEFPRVSNDREEKEKVRIEETEAAAIANGPTRKTKMSKSAKKTARRKSRRVAGRTSETRVNSSRGEDNHREENPSKNNSCGVGDVCGLVGEDSVAGMRVASSSRMDSSRVDGKVRGRKRSEVKESVDVKIRRPADDEDEGIVEDTVRTFEKGEIVVSVDGKFLPVTKYELFLGSGHSEGFSEPEEIAEDVGQGSIRGSLTSIEEPDVLECWEAETIEPVMITPRKMLANRGMSYDGEAAEDELVLEANAVNLERVQKYYRLAREIVDEDIAEIKRTVPNTPEGMADSYCSEELPALPTIDQNKIPVDEAFEVYESCYTGKAQFLPLEPGLFKARTTLFGQRGEGPIPCKAVCCNIQ